MSSSAKGSPSAWRRRFRDSTFSKLSTAASRPRLQATLSSTSSNDIVASIASPMNLRTWPPRVRNEAVSVSKVSFSISTICAPEVTSLIRVKPLRSAYHNTECRLLTVPRSTAPE